MDCFRCENFEGKLTDVRYGDSIKKYISEEYIVGFIADPGVMDRAFSVLNGITNVVREAPVLEYDWAAKPLLGRVPPVEKYR